MPALAEPQLGSPPCQITAAAPELRSRTIDLRPDHRAPSSRLHFLPVFIVAAIPQAMAAVSKLAKQDHEVRRPAIKSRKIVCRNRGDKGMGPLLDRVNPSRSSRRQRSRRVLGLPPPPPCMPSPSPQGLFAQAPGTEELTRVAATAWLRAVPRARNDPSGRTGRQTRLTVNLRRRIFTNPAVVAS